MPQRDEGNGAGAGFGEHRPGYLFSLTADRVRMVLAQAMAKQLAANFVAGSQASAPTDPAEPAEVSYSPNAGLDYSTLMGGAPPSILLSTWLPYARELKDRRLSNVPLTRSTNYYFSSSGSDSNDGSEASPWQSNARLNAIAAPLSGTLLNGNSLTVASSTPFEIANKSWWMFGWFRNNASTYFGPFFARENSYQFLLGATDGKPQIMVDGSTKVLWNEVLGFPNLTKWEYVEAWFDTVTTILSISANGGTPVTATLGAQFASTSNPLTVGTSAYAAGSHGGDFARLGFCRDMVPTNTMRAGIYNSGKGVRDYTMPSDVKAAFIANGGSFWNMNAVNGTTTYADAISGRTLTRAVAQNSVVPPGPDADAAITASGSVSGGANFRIRLNRGDKFAGPFRTLRKNIVVSDYGSGALPPVLTLFDVAISNSWTLVSGTRYKTTLATKPSWVKKVGDDYPPFSLVLKKAASAADCGATLNSFWWGSNELHLNVGADPATVSATGWEGTTSGTSNGFFALGGFERWENLILLGAGITEPGNSSGYGLQVTGNAKEEFVGKNLQMFYTGYHAFGHISTEGISTLVNCKAGLCASRNETAATDQPANGSIYVSYAGGGEQEFIMWNCEVTHGPLPSYDWTTNRDMEAVKTHTDGGPGEVVALQIYYKPTILNSSYPVGQSYNVGNDTLATIADSRCWIFEPVTGSQYPSGFAIVGYDTVYANVDVGTVRTGVPGYLFSTTPVWLVNCSVACDLADLGGSNFALIGNVGTAIHAFGCRFDFTNANGTTWKIADLTITGTEFKNSIITVQGSATKTLGSGASAGMFTNCAFRGLTGVGTGAVNLSAAPSLTAPPELTSQLFAAGATGVLEYDANQTARATTPTIGPIEAD
jgi:hypothetical protein